MNPCTFKILYGDAIDKCKDIESGSISFICSDLPFGKTRNKWDIVIPPELLWPEVWRICKEDAMVMFFGQDKFTAMMMLSDPNHRYNIIYEKTTVTGHLNANKQPLRCHEDMMFFYKSLPVYNPQKTKGHKRKVSSAEHKRNCVKTSNYGEHGLTTYDSTERYPRSVWKYKTDKQKSSLHPTQKPVELLEDLIKTYSKEGDLCLDITAGSGSFGEACMNTNRNCILIDNNEEMIKIMHERLC